MRRKKNYISGMKENASSITATRLLETSKAAIISSSNIINKPEINGGGGIVFPGNALCLCAEHKAKMEHAWDTPMFDYSKIRDNKLEIQVCGQNSIIIFNKDHYKFIKTYFDNRTENCD